LTAKHNNRYITTVMPPRTRYTADRIIEAALDLTRSQGIDAVTARSVAAALGCSTAPIFTQFASMDDLYEELMDRIIALFVETAGGVRHPDPLIGAGVGWLRFAANEPLLYEAVFLKRHPWHAKWGPIRLQLAQRMGSHPSYEHLDRAAGFARVGRAAIVMHGLGVEIWSGRRPDTNLVTLIEQLAAPVVDAALENDSTTDFHSSSRGPR